MTGLTLFWLYFPEADQERLVERLSASTALHFHQIGMASHTKNANRGSFKRVMLEAFVERYNKGLRNRLKIATRLADMDIPA